MYVLTISFCMAPHADVAHSLTFSGFLKCLPKLDNTSVTEMQPRHERFSNTRPYCSRSRKPHIWLEEKDFKKI